MPRLARGSVGGWIGTTLRARFPKLAAVMSERELDAMLERFFRAEPAAATSVVEASAKLPAFVAAEHPRWYAELALLDRARAHVLKAPAVKPLLRRDVTSDRELRLVPAHALVQLTTTADELWLELEAARPVTVVPRELDWPRSVLVWRAERLALRAVEPAEAAALREAVHGTSLVELAAGLGGDRAHARALDLVLRWLDAALLVA